VRGFLKNQWINFFIGYVEVKVTGQNVEPFLNELTRKNIKLIQLKRIGEDQVKFVVALNQVYKMRVIGRKYPCKITFHKRGGLPFLQKRMLSNFGFIMGMLLFLVTILLLSNVVWKVEVIGAKPETEYKILQELSKLGVEKGKFQFLIKEPDDIQRMLTQEIEAITWVGVELRGTTYHLQVVEKEQPEIVEKTGKQQLYAGKKAIIRKMFVEQGKAVVNINDFVQKGQLLVTSYITDREGVDLLPAKGTILGEVWYRSDVVIPLKTEFDVFNGTEEMKHYIKVGKVSIPFWGFGKTEIEDSETETVDKPLFFLGWKLPFYYKTVTVREKETIVREYTQKEAVNRGKEIAKTDLQKLIPKNSVIIGEKVLHERNESGKVVLSIHYQVLEDIVIERPIIQGD